ncbi:alkaline phosphatase family protein [Vicingaceae bacterium]|nr:alkaline phosphatase family protein [Vicingaceae bacterium]MDC1451466.1 alkaline phosphatase family protein [Vicingaceae bacterium]
MKTLFFLLLLLLSAAGFGQILSGPMIGHQTPVETKVWLQTEVPSLLNISYASKNEAEKTIVTNTQQDNWNTITIQLERLTPNTLYNYSILSSGKLLFQGNFKTPQLLDKKPLSDYSFAFGSCIYINEEQNDQDGEPFGRSLDIISNIQKTQPDFMLWLGDNIYLRKGEWRSKTGIYRRYTNFKSQPELQSFWQNTAHYAIWDDHDFGPNDADRSFVNKDITLQAFKDFWANPSYGINGQLGITSQFSYLDIEFFLLDNRYFRSPNERKTGEREILGKAQIEWLIDALVKSKANFKFVLVGGQFVSDAAVYENHANYAKERDYLLNLIENEGLKNIVFLTGDRHKTELSLLKLKNGTTLYDFTSSPMASKAFDSENEGNTNQVKGTHVATQNFGTITVLGDYETRSLLLKTFNASGKLLWEHKIQKQ